MSQSRRKRADEVLLLALACGLGVEQAAQQAGVNRRTVHRRMQDPEFRRQWQAARAELWRRTSGMLTAESLQAGKALLELLKSKVENTRLRAAIAILEQGTKMRDSVDQEERIVALERLMATRNPP
jgi:HEAT repeat protein